MLRLLLGLVCNAVALWVATRLVRGLALTDLDHVAAADVDQYTSSTLVALLVVAVVFTLVNAVVKPVVQLISLPFTVITLGLFLLVINAAMLGLTGWITESLHPFGAVLLVDGFWPAFWGGIVVGLVNWVLGLVLPVRDRR